MSTSRRSSAGVQPIPAEARELVLSLKEIVNNTEAEIYAALKECNMDPNDAATRLLSQDPFREVKSKKEKKKEGKDTTEPRSRGGNNNSNRGKIGADRHLGRGGTPSYNFSEPAPLAGKPSYKNRNKVPAGYSDDASTENKGSTADTVPVPASKNPSAWVGAPGQVSMADIVKKGRPQNKAYNSNVRARSLRYSNDPIYEEWPSIEKPPASQVMSFAEQHVESSAGPSDGINQQSEEEEQEQEEEEVQEEEDDDIENSVVNDVESDSVSNKRIPEDDSGGASLFENDLYKDMGSYQHQAHDFHEVEEVGVSVSSVTRSLQELSVEQDDRELPSEGCTHSVVQNANLHAQNANLSHLTFGSFGPGILKSVPVETNMEEPHSEADISSVGHLETRTSEYYVEDSLRNASSDGGLFNRSSASEVNYDPSPAPQEEELKPENTEVAQANQYSFPSNPGYTFDAAFKSHMQMISPFSDVMQSYTNTMPSNSAPHPTRESDVQYSPFPTQSMPTKYGNSVSEALKSGGPHTGTSVATGGPLPHPQQQHVAVHQYPPAANMMGFPYLPQSYTYLPSAFQQAFAGNGAYHQALAAVLPQYKNTVSAPPSAAGAFGNNTPVPANFGMNPSAAPTGTNLNYEEVLSSQYREGLASLQQQQNEAAMWLHQVANARTMPAVPASTYYNYQGQNQQQQQSGGGLRQGQQQQASQNYGGYPNFYQSRAGVFLDQQQQNARDGGSQGQQQQPKQSQIWQNSY